MDIKSKIVHILGAATAENSSSKRVPGGEAGRTKIVGEPSNETKEKIKKPFSPLQ